MKTVVNEENGKTVVVIEDDNGNRKSTYTIDVDIKDMNDDLIKRLEKLFIDSDMNRK